MWCIMCQSVKFHLTDFDRDIFSNLKTQVNTGGRNISPKNYFCLTPGNTEWPQNSCEKLL